MANQLNTVTDTYKGQSIQCAQFVIDTTSSLFRCEPLDKNDDYAFQMVAKANASNKSITVLCGNKSHTFTLTTSWAEYSYVFEGVTVNNSYLQFQFSANGNYYLYHSKLEHGNKVTDWDEADYDIRSYAEQTADRLSWVVESGTSASNFTLTDRTAQLIAQFININGLVAFGALTDGLRRLLQGTEKINVLANMESVSTAHEKMLYAYVNSVDGGVSESVTVDYDGTPKTFAIGKVADYSKWNATKRGYLPALTDAIIYHGYINSPLYESINLANADFWWSNTNQEWRMLAYNVEDGEVTSTSNVVVASQNDLTKAIIYAKSTVRRGSQTLNLIDSEAIGIYRYDVNSNTFVEYNRDTQIGSIIKQFTNSDMTLINGGKLMTNSVEADKMSVENLTAVSANIAGFAFSQDGKSIEYLDASGDWNSNPKIELVKDNGNPAQYGNAVYTYPYSIYTQHGYYPKTVSGQTKYVPFIYETLMGKYGPEMSYFEYNAVDTITASSYMDSEKVAEALAWFVLQQAETQGISHLNLSIKDGSSNELPFKVNDHEVYHKDNLVCGKITSSSVSGNTGSAVTISLPTAQIGTDPIVTVTTTRSNDNAWLGGVSTSGSNTLINIGIYNASSSAHTITVNYMIAKNS